jgi:hypothetical protein
MGFGVKFRMAATENFSPISMLEALPICLVPQHGKCTYINPFRHNSNKSEPKCHSLVITDVKTLLAFLFWLFSLKVL